MLAAVSVSVSKHLYFRRVKGCVASPDRGLREPAHGGRVHPAALAGHPGEHGAQQPQPVPPRGPGDHRGTAHRPPASVSIHTRTGAPPPAAVGGVEGGEERSGPAVAL